MSITATVENDTIKLPANVHLPDGTQVRLEPIAPSQSFETIAELERGNGFDVLPRRAGATVSSEDVRRLCAEEGI